MEQSTENRTPLGELRAAQYRASGDKVRVIGREVKVGKSVLVGMIRTAMASKQIEADLPASEERLLRDELSKFDMKRGRTSGVVRFEARGSSHDDAVVAVGLALLGRGLWGRGRLRLGEPVEGAA